MFIRENKKQKTWSGSDFLTKEFLNFWPTGTAHHVLSEKPPFTMPSYSEIGESLVRIPKKGITLHFETPSERDLKTCLSHWRFIKLVLDCFGETGQK